MTIKEDSVEVLYFASAKDATGVSSQIIKISELNGPTLENLLQKLKNQHKKLEEILKSCLIAINLEYTENLKYKLKNSDKIAFIPPVSGG